MKGRKVKQYAWLTQTLKNKQIIYTLKQDTKHAQTISSYTQLLAVWNALLVKTLQVNMVKGVNSETSPVDYLVDDNIYEIY